MQHVFTLDPDTGTLIGLYQELLPLRGLGKVEVQRASTVEFNLSTQQWEVRLPDNHQLLFSHASRDTCLDWERNYFSERL